MNKDGSFECKCNDGYGGDGLTCEGKWEDESKKNSHGLCAEKGVEGEAKCALIRQV